MLKEKLRFLFQGDSVTDAGRDYNSADLGNGYPRYFQKMYEQLRAENTELPELEIINRAVNGDRSLELVDRFEEDFAAVKPDILCVQIGVNDAWRIMNPAVGATPDPIYKKSVEFLLSEMKTRFPKTKIILIEPFLLAFDPEMASVRRNLYNKINVLRGLRREYADFYWPLDGLMHQWSLDHDDPAYFTLDGVHPTPEGHKIIGESLAKTLVQEGFFKI